MESRNPYILLGIPFGSSREAALTAFARKSRNLRRQGSAGKALMTDLTWSLSQVSETGGNPETVMGIYRVPADPDAFDLSGTGVMRPDAEPLARRYDNVVGAEDALQRRAGQEYLRYLIRLGSAGTAIQP